MEGSRSLLDEARARTLALVEPVSDADLDRQHDPLMSPLVWDLGHIAAFEDLWVCREAGLELLRPDLARLYDATETPRPERGELAYLRRRRGGGLHGRGARAHAEQLGAVSPFVGEMLVQHEHQHNETMLQTLQLARARRVRARARAEPAGAPATGRLAVDARPSAIGDAGEGFAYDNERPRHQVSCPPTGSIARP